jgi:hypothetical protein
MRPRGRWLGGFARRPLAAVGELLWRLPGREARLLARARAGAVGAVRTAPGRVVALDGFDALIALPLVRGGQAAAAPGAGRWLADALTSEPAAAEPPASVSAGQVGRPPASPSTS